MSEILRVNAWRVYEENYGYSVTNLDRGYHCKWMRNTGNYTFPSKSFRVPVTVDKAIHAREMIIGNSGLSSRTFGIEIECYHPTNSSIREETARKLEQNGIPCRCMGYTHTVMSSWKIVTDSSILGGYGLEVVSPILSGEEGIEQISKVVRILSELGCRVNRSTGLHIHHGANDLSSDQIKKVFRFYRNNESIFDSLVAPSRRGSGNRYCRSLRDYNDIPSTRYVKLNYQSYAKYGTLEVRHHQGSLNADKISHWIRLTQKVIERGYSLNRVYTTLEELVNDLGLSSMASWYLERAEELSA